jgi:hypothetical protein
MCWRGSLARGVPRPVGLGGVASEQIAHDVVVGSWHTQREALPVVVTEHDVPVRAVVVEGGTRVVLVVVNDANVGGRGHCAGHPTPSAGRSSLPPATVGITATTATRCVIVSQN